MRKLVLALIVLSLASCNLKQQEKSDKDVNVECKESIEFIEREVNSSDTIGFSKFLSLFKEKQADTETEIVDSLRARFLNLNWSEDELQYAFNSCVADSILFENKCVVGLVYTINCMAGGQCLTNHLAIFSRSGYLINQIKVGYEMISLESDNQMKFELNDNKLTLITTNIETDYNGNELSSTSDTSILTINTNTWEIK